MEAASLQAPVYPGRLAWLASLIIWWTIRHHYWPLASSAPPLPPPPAMSPARVGQLSHVTQLQHYNVYNITALQRVLQLTLTSRQGLRCKQRCVCEQPRGAVTGELARVV